MFENTDIIVERDGAFVCIKMNQGRLRVEPQVAREIASDLDRIATEIAQEILE